MSDLQLKFCDPACTCRLRHLVLCPSLGRKAHVLRSLCEHRTLCLCSVRQHMSPLRAFVTAVWPHHHLTCDGASHAHLNDESLGAAQHVHLHRDAGRPDQSLLEQAHNRRRWLSPSTVGAIAGNTTADDDSFWSSTGRLSQQGVDSLTFRLADPLCTLRAVSVAVYRARYQFG